MNSLTFLKNILHTLKKEEVKSLLRFLQYYKEPGENRKSKSFNLVQLILDDKNYTSKELQMTLYGCISYHPFNKLVLRLKEKILEIILFDSNLERNYYSIRNRSIFEIRKNLLQLDILLLKGLRAGIEKEYSQIAVKAKQFESYDILVQALTSKQKLIGFDKRKKKSKILRQEIQKAEISWMAFSQSQAIYFEMLSNMGSALNYNDYQKELLEALTTLKTHYENTNSPTIGYYYFFLLTDNAQNEFHYHLAEECLQKMLQLLSTNKSLYTHNRYGSTLLNIANNKIYLGDFENAIRLAIDSKEFLSDEPLNISIVEDIEFYCSFYKCDLKSAFALIIKLASLPRSQYSDHLQIRRTYLLSCIKFIYGEFNDALSSFNEFHEIEKDKEGWNIAKRISILLCQIELDRKDVVDLNLQNLEKFLKRMVKTKTILPRYILIFRILKKLAADNYDYKKVYASRKKYFDLLNSGMPEYKSKIRGPELIVFEEWYESKMQKRRYNHDLAIAKLFKDTAD